ncbi:unnamed protein product [Brassica rapa subsp. narinosa]|uniref:(rape) hypothetical protein n=1 Tax=Brassica napus TaxID=3708 RepID=A0A816VNP8_BRANA|nr:unnamed protein product [Brassica napus]
MTRTNREMVQIFLIFFSQISFFFLCVLFLEFPALCSSGFSIFSFFLFSGTVTDVLGFKSEIESR